MKRVSVRSLTRSLVAAALVTVIVAPAGALFVASPAAAVETKVTGRVVDEHGTGIVTRLHLFQADNRYLPVAAFFSAADGTFVVPDVDPALYTLRVESQDLLGPAPVWWADDPTRDPVQAGIIPIDGYPIALGDILYDSSPLTPPVADLRLHLGHSDGTDAPASTASLYRAGEDTPRVTIAYNPADQMRFFNVPTGLWDVLVTPHPLSGDLPSWYTSNAPFSSVDRPATPQVTMGGSLRNLTIHTQPNPYFGLFAGGTVQDEGGHPIAGALVNLHHDGGSVHPRYTDANGEFTFSSQMPDGDYRIEVSHPDFVGEWWDDAADVVGAAVVSVTDGHTEDEIVIRLAGYTNIRGIVTGPSDEYLENAPVLLLSDSQPNAAHILDTTFTDASGRYEFSTVPTGTYYLFFKAPAGSGLLSEWWNDTRVAADAQPITLDGTGLRDRFDAQLASNPQPEIPGETCHDPFGNVIACEGPGCEEGGEQCPIEPCAEGDEHCPSEPCRDPFGNEIPCIDPCEEGDGSCPPEPCEEGDENCPPEPCEEGDETCPPEPCEEGEQNCPAEPCEEGEENRPTDPCTADDGPTEPECPAGTTAQNNACMTTSTAPPTTDRPTTTPAKDRPGPELAKTGAGSAPLVAAAATALALLGSGMVILARRRRCE